ncbi:hypothetical protein Cni_G25630 [Canna indica]|uniref:Uncharacterized protein n=1 Tax=Canna indica TaxID=4628 RepID=A0AAQ3KXE2_9LILI|nr:hypothetical protein Cni_G25630 [Canna indica]
MEAAKVQRVSKASSDELLRKFAELDDHPPARASPPRISGARLLGAPIVIRKKKSRRAMISALSARELAASPADAAAAARTRRRRASGGLAEWKSLLPVTNRRPAHASLLRRMGIRRSEEGAPGIGLFLAAAFEKTWRKTVEGASKMFVEKHCHQTHVRLISDIV